MAGDTRVIVHFKDIERSDELHEALEKRCQQLATEFPETDRYELTLEPDANDHRAHIHVSGKHTSVASHASAAEPRQAAEAALDRIERELRKDHDKRIFTPRREARRTKARH